MTNPFAECHPASICDLIAQPLYSIDMIVPRYEQLSFLIWINHFDLNYLLMINKIRAAYKCVHHNLGLMKYILPLDGQYGYYRLHQSRWESAVNLLHY
jgi:hypothetical protein